MQLWEEISNRASALQNTGWTPGDTNTITSSEENNQQASSPPGHSIEQVVCAARGVVEQPPEGKVEPLGLVWENRGNSPREGTPQRDFPSHSDSLGVIPTRVSKTPAAIWGIRGVETHNVKNGLKKSEKSWIIQ